jgi:hypothetical protein
MLFVYIKEFRQPLFMGDMKFAPSLRMEFCWNKQEPLMWFVKFQSLGVICPKLKFQLSLPQEHGGFNLRGILDTLRHVTRRGYGIATENMNKDQENRQIQAFSLVLEDMVCYRGDALQAIGWRVLEKFPALTWIR